MEEALGRVGKTKGDAVDHPLVTAGEWRPDVRRQEGESEPAPPDHPAGPLPLEYERSLERVSFDAGAHRGDATAEGGEIAVPPVPSPAVLLRGPSAGEGTGGTSAALERASDPRVHAMAGPNGPKFGEYEVVRKLDQVGAAALYSVRRAGEAGPPRLAVKCVQFPEFW